MKNVLIISSSLRNKSNTEYVAREIEKGVRDAGNNVEFISLKDKDIKFCKGCLACQKTQKCVIKDDANEIVEKVKNADTLIFATPIYYYEMSGQLKTLLDRCNPLFVQDYKFRDVYLVTASDDDTDFAYENAVNGLKGWIACFEKSRFGGVFSAGGMNDPEEVKQNDKMLNDAYSFGNKIK